MAKPPDSGNGGNGRDNLGDDVSARSAAEAARAAEDERLRRLAERLLRKRGNLQSLGAEGAPADEDALAGQIREFLEKRGAVPETVPADALAAEVGRQAIEGLRNRSRNLLPAESASLQLIVETMGRPALRVRSDQIEPPQDPGENERWVVHLALRGGAMLAATRAVGAVFKQSGSNPILLGTAWRTRSGRLVTNRHVAKRIAEDPGAPPPDWTLATGREAWIDYSFFGTPSGERCRLTAIAHTAAEPWLDLAILEAEPPASGASLEIEWNAPVPAGREIYVVGHPQSNIDQPDLAAIFAKADGSKRLSPGEIDFVRPEARIFEHDCSTLSGNSGSCAIDFISGKVVGLHYGGVGPDETGALGSANLCVALAALNAHPSTCLLRAQGRS